MQDSPLGIRFADYASAFPAGGTVAASWDRDVWYQRGHDMGSEHRDKGVDVQLGPVVGPIGRAPEGGRNWEGFSPDPVLSGIAVAHTIKGIQDAGVIACTLSLNARRENPLTSIQAPSITSETSKNISDKLLRQLDTASTLLKALVPTSMTPLSMSSISGLSRMPFALALVPSCAATTRSTTAMDARTLIY
jgi:beta-glucosidase